MAGDTNAELPVWGYEVENFINLGTSEAPEWTEFDNLLSWDQSTDTNSYEPSYINRKNSPKFTLSKDFNVEYEVDLYKNNKLSTYLVEHEDEEDIPVEVVRVYNWLGEDGKRTAKKAAFLLTPTPVDNGTAGEPGKLKGSLNMKDESWTKGTWNGKTPAFTAAAKGL
jgi:hypothetical protein